MAKGFQQTVGIDFYETFRPIVKFSTIRIVLSLAVYFNWDINPLDINNAFLNGALSEPVCMEQPKGFLDPLRPHYVCNLSKALCGLKQAP